MVSAGVVAHPSKWPFCGYNEIQKPRRKNVLIDYDKFMELLGTNNYEQARRDHQIWTTELLCEGNCQDDKWSKSIAIGNKEYVDKIKFKLGVLAKGRNVKETDAGYQLRELINSYMDDFEAEKGYINYENR